MKSDNTTGPIRFVLASPKVKPLSARNSKRA
jgi:hypothetical protein